MRSLSWRYGKDFMPWVDKYCAHGTPEMVAAALLEYADAGVEHLALAMIHAESVALDAAPSLEASWVTLQTIERDGSELLPALHGAGSGG